MPTWLDIYFWKNQSKFVWFMFFLHNDFNLFLSNFCHLEPMKRLHKYRYLSVTVNFFTSVTGFEISHGSQPYVKLKATTGLKFKVNVNGILDWQLSLRSYTGKYLCYIEWSLSSIPPLGTATEITYIVRVNNRNISMCSQCAITCHVSII